MKLFTSILMLSASLPAMAITPEIDVDNVYTDEVRRDDIPNADISKGDDGFCFEDNFTFRGNPDGSFDLTFDEFFVETSEEYLNVHTTCSVVIPVKVPKGKKIKLTKMGLEGETEVSKKGKSKVVVRPGLINDNRDKTTKAYYYNKHERTQDVLLTAKIGADYTQCDDQEMVIRADIILSAKRDHHDHSDTYLSIDGGAVRYFLDYQDCYEPPKHNPWIADGYEFQYKTTHGKWVHGYMQIDGESGFYQTVDFAHGDLFEIQYSHDYKTVTGRWRFQNGNEGWFRFSTHDKHANDFYGEWGYGAVGHDTQGTWNGTRNR